MIDILVCVMLSVASLVWWVHRRRGVALRRPGRLTGLSGTSARRNLDVMLDLPWKPEFAGACVPPVGGDHVSGTDVEDAFVTRDRAVH